MVSSSSYLCVFAGWVGVATTVLLWVPDHHDQPLGVSAFMVHGQQSKMRTDSGTSTSSALFVNMDRLDNLTPEEEEERMRKVRQIQRMFYGSSGGTSSAPPGITTTITSSGGLLQHGYSNFPQVREPEVDIGQWVVPHAGDVLKNVPLFRTHTTELPGRQMVLTVEEPQYTHMFRELFMKPQPYHEGVSQPLMLFGHIYVPKGKLFDPEYRLMDNTDNEATRIGTLMQVADVLEDKHGKLRIIVQSLDIRFEVEEALQVAPYTVANVRLLQDKECQTYYDDFAAGSSMTTANTSPSSPVWDESIRWLDWEVRPTNYKDKDEHGNVGVSSLVNYNSNYFPKMTTYKQDNQFDGSLVMFRELEYHVWVALDTMLALSAHAHRISVPVPPQLLALLPTGQNWPEFFQLDRDAQKILSTPGGIPLNSTTVDGGLMGNVAHYFPRFVRVSPASTASPYPDVRRASRFSFAIWTFLENNFSGVINTPPFVKQRVLEMKSVTERLHFVFEQLEQANAYLRQSLAAAGSNSSALG